MPPWPARKGQLQISGDRVTIGSIWRVCLNRLVDLTALTSCLALGFVVAMASKRFGLGPGLAIAGAGTLAAWMSGSASGGFSSETGTTSPHPSLIFTSLVDVIPVVVAGPLYLAGLTLGSSARRTPLTTLLSKAALGTFIFAARVFVVAGLAAVILPINVQPPQDTACTALLIAVVWSLGEPFLSLDGRCDKSVGQRTLWCLVAALPTLVLFRYWAASADSPFVAAVGEPFLREVGIALIAGAASAAVGSLLGKTMRSDLSPFPAHLAVAFGAVAIAVGFSGDPLVAALSAGAVYAGLTRMKSTDPLSSSWEAGAQDGAWNPLRLGASIIIVSTAGWMTPTVLSTEMVGRVLCLLVLAILVQVLLSAVTMGIQRQRMARAVLAPLFHGWAFFPGTIAIAASVLVTDPSGDALLAETLAGPILQFILLSLVLQGSTAPILERRIESGERTQHQQLGRLEQLDAKWLAVRAAARTVDDLQADGLVSPATALALSEALNAELGKIEVEKTDLDPTESQQLGQRRWTQAIRLLLDSGRAAVERARREGRISDNTADATLRELSQRWERADEQSVRGLFDDR